MLWFQVFLSHFLSFSGMRRTGLAFLALALPMVGIAANDRPAMFGVQPSRNMVADEVGLPDRWDPETGLNIIWVAELGSETYAGPTVWGDWVFVGTNNQHPRDPAITGDRGVLMAFRAKDGQFMWQAIHDKLASGSINDWPLQGVCSSPFVEGERLYYLSNRCEVIALDALGFYDGENDGNITSEANSSKLNADLIWSLDMMGDLKVHPFNMTASAPLVVGDILFTNTSNGKGEGGKVPVPEAPSFLAINKKTGKVVWQDASPGTDIVDGQWSSPAYGLVAGQPQVVFGGGNGWIYAFEPERGSLIWKFDCNSHLAAEKRAQRQGIVASPTIHNNRVYVGIGQNPEHGPAPGALWAIDATGKGDVTASAAVWRRGGEDFTLTLSTVAIHQNLIYAVDLNGFLNCLDANTGALLWNHDNFANVWGSPLVADGKVYLGDEDGDVVVLAAAKEKKLLLEVNMGHAIYTTPTVRDGVLYIASTNRLFAIGTKKP